MTPCERVPGHTPGGGYPVCRAGTRDAGSRAAAYRPVGPAPLSPACLLAPPGRLCLPRPRLPPGPCTHQFPRRVRPAVYFLLKYPGRCHQEAPQRRERGGRGEQCHRPRKMNGRLPLFLLLSDFRTLTPAGLAGTWPQTRPCRSLPGRREPEGPRPPGVSTPSQQHPQGHHTPCGKLQQVFFLFLLFLNMENCSGTNIKQAHIASLDCTESLGPPAPLPPLHPRPTFLTSVASSRAATIFTIYISLAIYLSIYICLSYTHRILML